MAIEVGDGGAPLKLTAFLDSKQIEKEYSKLLSKFGLLEKTAIKGISDSVKKMAGSTKVETPISPEFLKRIVEANELFDKLPQSLKNTSSMVGELKASTEFLGKSKKALNTLYSNGTITIGEYLKSSTAIVFEQFKNSKSLRELNLELKQNIQLENAATGSLEEARIKYNQLTAAITKAGGAIDGSNPAVATMVSQHKALRAEIDAMEQKMGMYQRNVGNYASGWNGMQNSINQLTRELPAFTFSAQTGFMAIANNIPIMVDEIVKATNANKSLNAEGKKGVPVWKQLSSALFSWQTVMMLGITAITVYGKEIGEWVKAIFSGKKAIDSLKESQNALNSSLKSSEYTTAVTDVTRLKSALDMANKGFVDKKSVVDEYNKSIGQTAGEVKTLSEVESFLVNNADNYIKMTLYKAAANLQLAEAAKKAAEIQETSQKKSSDFTNTFDTGLMSMLVSGSEYSSGIDIDLANKALEEKGKERKKALEIQLKEEQKAYESNANTLLKKAQEYANKMGIAIFGNKQGEPKNPKDKKDTAQRDYESALASRESVLEKIAELDKEYLRKELSPNESEIQAIKDRFTEIRKVIAKENESIKKENDLRKGKPVDLIDGSALNSKEDLFIAQARKRQEDEAQKLYIELLKNYETYQQKLQRIDSEFEKERIALGENITEEQKRIWQERKDAEISQIQETEAAKNKILNDGAKQFMILTTANIVAQIKVIKDLLAKSDISDEMRLQLEGNLGKLQENLKLGATAANVATLKSKIAELQNELIKLSKAPGSNPKEIEKINSELVKTQEEVDDLTKKELTDLYRILQLIGQELGELGEAFSNMGDAFGSEVLSGVGDALSGIAINIDKIAVAFDKSATSADKYAAAAQSLVSIISMVANASADRKRAEEEYYRAVIQMQNEYNLSKAEQLRLESQLGESLYVKNYVGRVQDGMKSAEFAIGKYKESIQELAKNGKISKGLENAVDWKNVGGGAASGAVIGGAIGSVVPVIGNIVGAAIGAIVGGIVGLFGGKKKKPKYEELYANLPKEIVDTLTSTEPKDLAEVKALLQSLNNDKAVDANTKQMIEGTLKWIEQIEKAREQVREVVQELSGSLGNELRNSLVNAFKAGENAALAMGKTVDKVIEDMLSQLLFSKAFDVVFKDLEDKLTDTLVFGDEGDIIDVFSDFLDKAGTAGDKFYELMEAAKKAGLENGMNIFGDSGKGSQGSLASGITPISEVGANEMVCEINLNFKIAI